MLSGGMMWLESLWGQLQAFCRWISIGWAVDEECMNTIWAAFEPPFEQRLNRVYIRVLGKGMSSWWAAKLRPICSQADCKSASWYHSLFACCFCRSDRHWQLLGFPPPTIYSLWCIYTRPWSFSWKLPILLVSDCLLKATPRARLRTNARNPKCTSVSHPLQAFPALATFKKFSSM